MTDWRPKSNLKKKMTLNVKNLDYDKDGVPNWRDCNPHNPNEQGWIHDRLKGTKEYVSKRYGEYTEEREGRRQTLRSARTEAFKEYATEKAKIEKETRLEQARRKARRELEAPERRKEFKRKVIKHAKTALERLAEEEARKQRPRPTTPVYSPFTMPTSSSKRKKVGPYFSLVK